MLQDMETNDIDPIMMAILSSVLGNASGGRARRKAVKMPPAWLDDLTKHLALQCIVKCTGSSLYARV